MDRDNIWSRRSNTNKPSLDTSGKAFPALRRAPSTENSKNNLLNGVAPLSAAATASPGASSAFGLGSGAFASFGSATKTPKTPGTAFDFAKAVSSPALPADDKSRSTARFTAPATQSASKEQAPDVKTTWPLKYSWIMWYRPPTSKNSDYEKSIKPMYKLTTAQEFWKVYAHLKRPSALPTVSDYHFFKDNIRPVWEDEENKRGGKWIIRLKKGVIDRYWEDMLLAVVGDQFAEAGEEVCGMVVSVRSGEDVLSVWTKIDGGRNIKIRETIKRILSLPSDTIIIWKSHDDSIAQRSAIDQARQEKGSHPGGEKRRATLGENSGNVREKSTVL